MKKRLILAINPGSTSTKFGLYSGNDLVFGKTLRHTGDELKRYTRVTDQFHFRKDLVVKELTEHGIDLDSIVAVVGRGGLIKPIESGVYEVNNKMKHDLANGIMGQHASNLGGLIASDIAASLPAARAFIVDPVVVDELEPIARISGHPAIERISVFHALNQKAVARLYAESVKKRYEDLNLIIAHMGGGVSVGAHRKGRVIDVNNALDGEGPFSPERSGGLPSGQLAALCFSGKYTAAEIKSMITGNGGVMAYMGTNSFTELCEMARKGNQEAILVKEALAYQVSKEIGALATVLEGEVDAIILTGGLAHEEEHVGRIRQRTGFLAPVIVYPGEDEIRALAFNGLLAMDGLVEIKEYH